MVMIGDHICWHWIYMWMLHFAYNMHVLHILGYFISEGTTVHPVVHKKFTLTVSIWCCNILIVTDLLLKIQTKIPILGVIHICNLWNYNNNTIIIFISINHFLIVCISTIPGSWNNYGYYKVSWYMVKLSEKCNVYILSHTCPVVVWYTSCLCVPLYRNAHLLTYILVGWSSQTSVKLQRWT